MDTNITFNVTVSTPANFTIQYMYIGFAILNLASNMIIGSVLIQNKYLFQKSAFIMGLAIGDTILGLGTLLAGATRIGLLLTDTKDVLIQPYYCLKTFTILLMIGTQLPAVMIFLISTERLLAVVFFYWYYKRWSNQKAWCMIFIGFLYCTASVASGWIDVYNFPTNITTPLLCTTSIVVGPIYATYHFYVAVFAGVWAIVTTIISLLTFINKRKKLRANANDNFEGFIIKQWQMTMSTTSIAVFDFTLVVIPNILLSMTAYFPNLLLLGNYATCMLCLRSTSNLFIYIAFNRDFRSTLLNTFKAKTTDSVQRLAVR